MKQLNNVNIENFTTYKLEGNIPVVYFPENVSELKELLLKLKKENKKYKIIGNGSNLIISSKYDGVLIKLENFDKLVIEGNIVKVGSGYMLSKLSLECVKRDLSGLEFAVGIPATVGGAIYQNAGAYGKQMDMLIKNVKALDDKGNIVVLSKDDLNFGYRDSIFKYKDYVCIEATLELKKDNYDNILSKMQENLSMRKEKQPLEYPSAGSVFRNPIGFSAGKLIEDAGLKGVRVGDAMVSLKHANFIVNVGNASGEDIVNLIKIIKDKVKEETGIVLEEEQEFLE